MMKGQCMPRPKSNSCSAKNKSPTPMTLLERFREAVLRLMMLSALSRATTTTSHGGSGDRGGRQRRYCSSYDPHHSEAVADCIEFIKKKAANDDITDENRHSSASCSADDTAEIVVSVSVMSCNT